MGHLTDDMALLRRNIDSSHENRLAQQNARKSSVSAQIADFASTRARNGSRDTKARVSFVTDNANNVTQMLNAFHHLHQELGRQGRKDRVAFVNNVSKKTLDLLAGFNADLKSMAERSAKGRADFVANNSRGVTAFINAAAQERAESQAAYFGTATSKKKSSISIETSNSAQPVITEVMHTSVSLSPHEKAFEHKTDAAVSKHAEDNKTKKPNKQPGKF
jgi:hypothetical protein